MSRIYTSFTPEDLQNKTNQGFLYEAAKLATRRSRAHGYYGTGAVIVNTKSWQIVSNGWSHISEFRRNESWSLHAEIHALARTPQLFIATGMSSHVIYVTTVRKHNDTWALGKPCLGCAISLKAAGLRYAIYSVKDKEIGLLDVFEDLKGLKTYPSELS